MKVKSFCYGTMNGFDETIVALDCAIEKLGSIEIHSITDTLYPTEVNCGKCEKVVRVVVYTPIK
jgi:predicted RNA-binding protein with EMAP domain